jgi:hypothetical protein
MQCWDRNIHRTFRRRQEEGAYEASMGGKGTEGCVGYHSTLIEIFGQQLPQAVAAPGLARVCNIISRSLTATPH